MESFIRPLMSLAGIMIGIFVVLHFLGNPALIIHIASSFAAAIWAQVSSSIN